ncbi:gamma-glutamyl-gamma-aminobutyrate hydrolase family protein [Mycolicibacterium komossense]|uniref:Gamma-glutamyl-gamma-aminobutyrate hydrolase family protein n=1 Tax=Mycolicibacterium komossense TaxID=1779 RepID=A0ABT3CFB7_9MYCO|nr:gamma-glutamyl-gamma-aminobutyrate hydrolase family protein [Mycolicibacterium komossense]MCV7228209.1 gamma-glutamyl-gamma-aminobutyrate hydrolase family protein [Mycolicibacterium komossense]
MTAVGICVGPTERGDVIAAFTSAVLKAGGTPLLLPSSVGGSDLVDDALSRVDVLLLSGGGDIHPAQYGEERRTTLDAVDSQRDKMEVRAVVHALHTDKRILGVCRGAQLLAVATGGSLIQDLTSEGFDGHIDERHDRGYATLRHSIKAEVGSLADNVLAGLDHVNSHHHQAIKDVGGLLTATAWAHDGVIEAVEAPGVLGVQWHPEALINDDERHLEPFRWLVHGH